MIYRLINFAAVTVALLLLLGACVTPFVPTIVAVAVGGAEVHSIMDTGLPACVHILRWSDWRQNDGTIQFSDRAPPSAKLQGAEIVTYRIAYARGIVSQYTFYQGRYRRLDGSEIVAPASGPVSLISALVPGIVGTICLQLCIAGLLFAWVVRRAGYNTSATPGQKTEDLPRSG